MDYVPAKKRKLTAQHRLHERLGQKSIRQEREAQREQQRRAREKALMGGRDTRTLLDVAHSLTQQGLDPEQQLKQKEAQEIFEAIKKTAKDLVGHRDLAEGRTYSESMTTTWRPTRKYRERSEEMNAKIRDKFHIEVHGEQPIAPPIRKLKHMRFPTAVVAALATKGIIRPTPIQMQALPVCLSGRDCIGIAYTGSGKTMVFALPMIMLALEEELKMPLIRGEGPLGVIICPSQELANQTKENVEHICKYIHGSGEFPELRTMLCTGGIDLREQRECWDKGMHMLVATPGRLKDCLTRKKFTFDNLKYFCLDEADRLMDVGFDEDIRDIMDFIHVQVQKVFFSATMPHKVRDLARRAMVMPVTVNVGRAGAANLDVIQEVEYVKDEAKILYLLECLKKTGPPVLVFCSSQADVDDVHEYLLLKGVMSEAIHGGKSKQERMEAVNKFKASQSDVLVATDVMSKGLDFPDIRHVINFDMPSEIEDYIHRIGRTGRCGKTGVATTFININVAETTLLDLKGLLMEAKQRIPPILKSIGGGSSAAEPCKYCGGLGHQINECAKMRSDTKGEKRGIVDDRMLMDNY